MSRRVYGGQAVDESAHKKKTATKHSVADIILISVAGCLLLGGLFFGFQFFKEDKKNADVIQFWDDIKDIANDEQSSGDNNVISSEAAYSTNPIDREINWDDLLEINSDIACWIYIPDTNVDYPVMQEPKYGREFYLYRDIYKNYFVSGSLFIPKAPEGYTDDHLLICGHNMKNGLMFSQLLDYKEKSFYDAHPYIYLYYPDRTEKWTIWSAYHARNDNKVYYSPYELNTKGYADLLDEINDNEPYDTLVTEYTPSTYTMTLSTCDKIDTTSGRYIVNAILSETKQLE